MNELRTTVVRDILKFGAFLQRIGDRVLRPFGISQQEYAVLSAIVREVKPLNQTTIVVDLLVERSNLSKIVSRLAKKGLIEVRPTREDRRLRLLKVSPAGRNLFRRADVALKRWNKEWMKGFTRDDVATLRELLHRLNSSPAKIADDLDTA
jgi:DNA-binding MarR family transcriptional regulator